MEMLNPVIMEFGKFRELCRYHGNFCGETGMMCTHLKCPHVTRKEEKEPETIKQA